MSLSSRDIKQKAAEIGLDKVGIAAARALEGEADNFRGWLDRGYHGEMAWLAREPEKRADPRILMPGAKSVIAVALNYFTPRKHSEAPGLGKISRYAWGDDYHDVLKEKLRELASWITSRKPEVNIKICVDTAPIMDKAWAVRAGLGWIGKHTNLITKELGSWVFLGEMILDLELEYDVDEMEDHCGTCTKCLDACPTGAITEQYVVDSNKCLSYATIELRSDRLPEEIERNMEGWFYGCDICQDVCPWNRFESHTDESRFEPRMAETTVDLKSVMEMTPEEYAARFRRSAIKRAKLPALKRNAAALLKEANPDAD